MRDISVSRIFLTFALLFVIPLFLSSCVEIPSEISLNSVISFLNGEGWNPKSAGTGNKGENRSASTPNASADTEEAQEEAFNSSAAKNAKANSELLHEIFQVVYMREPKDRSEFGDLVDTLNQGASLEGIYNGLVHSGEYRRAESLRTGASAKALQVFGVELAYVESELAVPTQFDASSAAPLALLGKTELDHTHFGEPSPTPKPDPNLFADGYSKQFVGASIFTLKRVLGDEALKLIAEKALSRGKLATWYSKWAVRLASKNIDFGIPLRNKSDEIFHYKWALSTSEDRIRWEVLNRIHRILNDSNRLKQ